MAKFSQLQGLFYTIPLPPSPHFNHERNIKLEKEKRTWICSKLWEFFLFISMMVEIKEAEGEIRNKKFTCQMAPKHNEMCQFVA